MKRRIIVIAVVVSAIIVFVGAVFVSNVIFYLKSGEHIQRIDKYILDMTNDESVLEKRISELHVCQKLLLYGDLLAAQDYSHYNYGKDEEPYSEEQTEGTRTFMKLHQFNSKVFDELDCRDISSEWESDEFYEFHHDILESNFDVSYDQ